MPEEYDIEESIEHSHISDQDLFNLTSSVMRRDKCLRMQEKSDLLELDEASSSETNSSHSESSSASSSLKPVSSILNGLFPNTSLYSTPVEDNDRAKKILQSC